MNRDIHNLQEAYIKIYIKEDEDFMDNNSSAYPVPKEPAPVNPHEKGEDNEKWKHFVSHRHPNMHPGIDYTEGRDAEGEYVIWDEIDPQEGGITKWHHKMYKHRDNPESISKDEFDKLWKTGKNYDEYWSQEKKRYEDGIEQLKSANESVDEEEDWGEGDDDKLPPKKDSDEEEVTEDVETDDEGWGEDEEENDKLPPKKDSEEVEEAVKVKVPSRKELIAKKRSPIHKPTKTIKPKKGIYNRKKIKKEHD